MMRQEDEIVLTGRMVEQKHLCGLRLIIYGLYVAYNGNYPKYEDFLSEVRQWTGLLVADAKSEIDGMVAEGTIPAENFCKDYNGKRSAETSSEDVQRFVDMYNEKCTILPKVVKISGQRKATIRRYLEKHTFEDWNALLDKVMDSDFLTGRSRVWLANFDWIVAPRNVVRIMEGNYDNRVYKMGRSQQRSSNTSEQESISDRLARMAAEEGYAR